MNCKCRRVWVHSLADVRLSLKQDALVVLHRSINYDERDPFLCNACGFCKYAKFDYTLTARPCCAVDPIENEEDRKKVWTNINPDFLPKMIALKGKWKKSHLLGTVDLCKCVHSAFGFCNSSSESSSSSEFWQPNCPEPHFLVAQELLAFAVFVLLGSRSVILHFFFRLLATSTPCWSEQTECIVSLFPTGSH